MRVPALLILIAAWLGSPSPGVAQLIGTVVESDGSTSVEPCELYAVKADGGDATDWQAHLFAKGAEGLGLLRPDFDGGQYQVLDNNFTRPSSGTDVVAMFVTCSGGRLHVDSIGLFAGSWGFMNAALLLTIGNAPDGSLALPGDDSPYAVDFGGGAVDFPAVGIGAGSGAAMAINYAFAPFPEQNDDRSNGYSLGAAEPDPASPLPDGGFIIGYNVYRMSGAGTPPDVATLGTMANWVAFVSMDFDQTVGDPGAPGTPAPADNAPLDAVGMQNPDGQPYTGDEVLLFQDSARRPDGSLNPFGADPEQSYWYAVQPVVRGSVAGFSSASLAGGPIQDHAFDLDGDTIDDVVDLDLDGSPEFFSPNENAGISGLGLTNSGLPLLSPVAWADPARLPAEGELRLELRRERSGMRLTIHAPFETAETLGYRVWRVTGLVRELVSDGLIVARGGAGNSYELLDRRLRARRQSWLIEIVRADGAQPEWLGPFEFENRRRR